MGGTAVVVGAGLVVALVVLLALTVGASLVGGLGIARPSGWAALRATLQLALVALVIGTVVRSLWLTAAFVVLMFAVAGWTSSRRVVDRVTWGPALAIGAGAAPVLAVVLASGTVPPAGIAIVPIAGIVVGGAMTATSLAGRRALADLAARYDEYEAMLALGADRRGAVMFVCRPAAAQAMVPPLDQTRTVGLVTLPGAFVGVLLGSGDAVAAATAQLLVLVGLLAAESIAVVTVLELVARGRVRRAEGPDRPAPSAQ